MSTAVIDESGTETQVPRWHPDQVRGAVEHIRDTAPTRKSLAIDGSDELIDNNKLPAVWDPDDECTPHSVQAERTLDNTQFWRFICTCGFVSGRCGPGFELVNDLAQAHLVKHALNPEWDGTSDL